MTTDESPSLVRPKRRAGKVLLTIGLVVLIGAAIYVRNITKPRATPPPPLPVPNAYDAFLKSASAVPDLMPNQGKFDEASLEALKAYVQEHLKTIEEVRGGLGKPARVPLIYNSDLTKAMDRVQNLRRLSRLVQANAVLAARENRHDDAARLYVDLVRLGPMIGQGGLWIDVLVGVAVESIGQAGLQKEVPHIGKERLRESLAALRETSNGRETFAEVKNTEAYWSEHTMPFHILLMLRMNAGYERLVEPTNQAGNKAILRASSGNQQLQLRIARQLYKLDQGDEPEQDSRLVPDYLPELPPNPVTSPGAQP